MLSSCVNPPDFSCGSRELQFLSIKTLLVLFLISYFVPQVVWAQDVLFPNTLNTKYNCVSKQGKPDVMISLSKRDRKIIKNKVMTAAKLEKIISKATKKMKRASGSQVTQLRRMKKLATKLLRLIAGCTPSGGGGQNFEGVFRILEANCSGCHTTWNISEQGLLASGRVKPQDLAGSPLFTFLAGSGYEPGYMPFGRDPLPQEAITVIRNWIMSIPVNQPDNPPPPPVTFACNSASPPGMNTLKRLTTPQYRNTILDMLSPLATLPNDYTAVWSAVNEQLNLVPPDHVQVAFLAEPEFYTLANDISQPRTDSWFRTAAVFASAVTETSARRIAFSESNCDPGSNSASNVCIDNFIARIGLRSFRRPLTTGEHDSLETYFRSRAVETRMSDLIVTLLLSPQFLFHFELNGAASAQDSSVLELTPYEIASRLSYTFWNTMPNDMLFEAAANNRFADTAQYHQIVNEVFDSERTRLMLDDFWTSYLHLDYIPPANASNTASFNAAAAGLGIEPSDEELAQDLRDEVLALAEYYTLDQPSSYDALMTSSLSFARSAKLAAIYGAAPWAGPGNPPVSLPEARGLFARAGLLFTGTENSKPITRASRYKREVLCQPVNPPSEEIANLVRPPEPDPSLSTRERFHQLTQGAPCAGCHNSLNPAGWLFERYDGLGRSRNGTESVYGLSGQLLAQHLVNSVATVQLLPDYSVEMSSPQELFEASLEVGQPQACLSQQVFRYHNRRRESQNDYCALESMRATLTSPGATLKDFFRSVAFNPHFMLNHMSE